MIVIILSILSYNKWFMYGPYILNLRLYLMKGRVIRYIRSTLLISVHHFQILSGEIVYNWTFRTVLNFTFFYLL